MDYLNSVYYIGINLSSIDPENAYNRIKNFESIISTYKSLPIVMMLIFFILFSLHGLFASDLDSLIKKLFFIILYLLLILTLISLLIVYLTIDIKYIMDFLDKINSDFEFGKSQMRIDIIILLIFSSLF